MGVWNTDIACLASHCTTWWLERDAGLPCNLRGRASSRPRQLFGSGRRFSVAFRGTSAFWIPADPEHRDILTRPPCHSVARRLLFFSDSSSFTNGGSAAACGVRLQPRRSRHGRGASTTGGERDHVWGLRSACEGGLSSTLVRGQHGQPLEVPAGGVRQPDFAR